MMVGTRRCGGPRGVSVPRLPSSPRKPAISARTCSSRTACEARPQISHAQLGWLKRQPRTPTPACLAHGRRSPTCHSTFQPGQTPAAQMPDDKKLGTCTASELAPSRLNRTFLASTSRIHRYLQSEVQSQ